MHNMEHSMNRATATAFALALAASAGGAAAQTVLWGGSPTPAPSGQQAAAPIYTGPSGAAPTAAVPYWTPPSPGPGSSGFPTSPPPSSGTTYQGFPAPTPTTPGGSTILGIPTAPPPSAGTTFQGFPSAPPPSAPPSSISGPSSAGSGGGWPGGYGRWSRDRDQDPVYNAWRGDDSERARELVQRLERLISAAERQRAADPEFLRDLRDLLDRYEGRDGRPGSRPGGVGQPPRSTAPVVPVVPVQVQPRIYMSDDFADGDFTRGTVWTPRQGQWSVDPANGLRSIRPTAPQAVSRQISPQELLQALLVGPQSLGLGAQQAPPNAALIEYAQTIPNAFTLRARLTDHGGDGAVHLILHQGGTNWNGYRLELRGGPDGRAVLTRRGASGYTDLASAPLRRLGRNVAQDVEWTRNRSGAMTVRVGGETLFSVTDAGFRDDWRGFAFFNAGGDYSMRAVVIEENR